MYVRIGRYIAIAIIALIVLAQASEYVNTTTFSQTNINVKTKSIKNSNGKNYDLLPAMMQDSVLLADSRDNASVLDESLSIIDQKLLPQGSIIPINQEQFLVFSDANITIENRSEILLFLNFTEIDTSLMMNYATPVVSYFTYGNVIYIAAVFFTMNLASGSIGQKLYFFQLYNNELTVLSFYDFTLGYHFLFGYVTEIVSYDNKFYFPSKDTSLRIWLKGDPFVLLSFDPLSLKYSNAEMDYPFDIIHNRQDSKMNYVVDSGKLYYIHLKKEATDQILTILTGDSLDIIFQLAISNDLFTAFPTYTYLPTMKMLPNLNLVPIMLVPTQRTFGAVGVVLPADRFSDPYLLFLNQIELQGTEQNYMYRPGFEGTFYLSYTSGRNVVIHKIRSETIGRILGQIYNFRLIIMVTIIGTTLILIGKEFFKNEGKNLKKLYPKH